MTCSLSRRALIFGTAALPFAGAPALADQIPDDPYPVQRLPANTLPPKFRRTIVPYSGRQWPGTIIVDTASRHLYYILPGGEAIRYGCGVGRQGFAWAGQADIARKVMWPRWTPPKEMVARDPNARKWKDGMPGGPDNPLGARALYLYQNGQDTLYRIHGTNAPKSIGTAASSGCIRMLNEDVVELYRRTPIGSRVIVLAEGV